MQRQVKRAVTRHAFCSFHLPRRCLKKSIVVRAMLLICWRNMKTVMMDFYFIWGCRISFFFLHLTIYLFYLRSVALYKCPFTGQESWGEKVRATSMEDTIGVLIHSFNVFLGPRSWLRLELSAQSSLRPSVHTYKYHKGHVNTQQHVLIY